MDALKFEDPKRITPEVYIYLVHKKIVVIINYCQIKLQYKNKYKNVYI